MPNSRIRLSIDGSTLLPGRWQHVWSNFASRRRDRGLAAEVLGSTPAPRHGLRMLAEEAFYIDAGCGAIANRASSSFPETFRVIPGSQLTSSRDIRPDIVAIENLCHAQRKTALSLVTRARAILAAVEALCHRRIQPAEVKQSVVATAARKKARCSRWCSCCSPSESRPRVDAAARWRLPSAISTE